jgi:SpoVK/Ycf46/Vps4 family AAA+-type ATPase
MEFWEPASIQDVGGLSQLKTFIANRAKAFDTGNENLPRPKGVLLVGIPGTGKSLSCKAAASIMGWPLIKLDIGSLKGSLVGESERKIRQATAVIDAFGEAVVWIDEVDKGFSGAKSSGETDAGTTAGMFGHFLTWRAESKSSTIVMATANSIQNLPPEFLRAGRFDATFFVDLPTLSERSEIIKIMNRKHNTEIPVTFAPKLEGWSGAEIEQLAKDSLYDGIDDAFKSIVPLSKTMKEEVQTLREWSKTRARLANAPEEDAKPQRKIHSIKKEAAA